MGRGNYYPGEADHGQAGEGYRMCYVDWPPFDHEHDEDDLDQQIEDYDGLKEALAEILPSFYEVHNTYIDDLGDNGLIYLRCPNALFEIWIVDNEWSKAIVLMSQQYRHDERWTDYDQILMEGALNKLADHIFQELHQRDYEIHERVNAWQSRIMFPEECSSAQEDSHVNL